MSLPLNMPSTTSDKYQAARYNMVEQQVRPWSLGDEQVLELIGTLRREEFVPQGLQDMAFMDIQLPLLGDDGEVAVANGHCMLPPRVEARILQDLKLKPHENVLEIGTGSGYMVALMSRMAKQVTTMEISLPWWSLPVPTCTVPRSKTWTWCWMTAPTSKPLVARTTRLC